MLWVGEWRGIKNLFEWCIHSIFNCLWLHWCFHLSKPIKSYTWNLYILLDVKLCQLKEWERGTINLECFYPLGKPSDYDSLISYLQTLGMGWFKKRLYEDDLCIFCKSLLQGYCESWYSVSLCRSAEGISGISLDELLCFFFKNDSKCTVYQISFLCFLLDTSALNSPFHECCYP